MRGAFGKYLLDLSKIIFAGGILSKIVVSENISDVFLLFTAGSVSLGTAIVGLVLIKKSEE